MEIRQSELDGIVVNRTHFQSVNVLSESMSFPIRHFVMNERQVQDRYALPRVFAVE